MDISELLDYMYSLERFGTKLGLEVITKLLKLLGNPEKDLKIIHIAGTNGKGSTAAMIDSILRTSEKTVGLYTSPHLVKFNERIKVNGEKITDEEIAGIVLKIKKVCEEENIQTTFFEFTTAVALVYFAEKKPEYVILETGMGGRLDATNVGKPILSLITNISIDHVEHLGETYEEIAYEKAKIIRENTPLITAETKEPIVNVFKKECEEKNSEYHNINDEFSINISESDTQHQIFSTNGNFYELNLIGEHQVMNAAVAVKACELLEIDKENIVEGLKTVEWHGRLEKVSDNPLIIVDAAHNYAGMIALRKFLEKNYPKVFLVLGVSTGKYKKEMIKEILPFAEKIILTKAKYHGEEPEELKKVIDREVLIVHDAKQAVKKAIEMNEGLPILITGSIYMIGEAEELFLF
ncbi:bifunctional folylpolyglutamate synthase/dihydrofolate synthase [Bacteroidota bacterium]